MSDLGTQLPTQPPQPSGVTINLPTQSQPQPPAQNQPPVNDGQFVTREEHERMLAQVREEEKNKLYPEMQRQSEELRLLNEDLQRRQQAEQAAEQQRQAEEQARIAEETSAKDLLAQTEQRFQAQLDDMRAGHERERAIFAKEQELAALNEYRITRIAQERDFIAPQFDDLVRGNNQAEIDASIEDMKARTGQIVAEFQAANGGGGGGIGGQPARGPAPLPVSGAPTHDMAALTGAEGTATFTPQELYDMPLEEYSRLRPQLLGAASARVRDQGLYAP